MSTSGEYWTTIKFHRYCWGQMLTGILWILWLLFTIGHVLIWIPFGALFYSRRNHHPLKNSRPNVIMLANIGGIGFSLITLLEPIYGSSMNTYAAEAIGGTSLGILFDSYFVLASSLYFAFNKTVTQLELQSSKWSDRGQNLSASIATIRKYAFFLSDRWAYIYVALNIIVYNIATFTYAIFRYRASFSLPLDVAFRQPEFFYFQGVTTAKLFTANMLLCIVAFQIRLIKDEIGIKKLLKRSAVATLVIFIIFWCLAVLDMLGHINYTFELLAAVVGADAVFIISVIIPAVRSYQAKASVAPTRKTSLLEGFLRASNGYAAFKLHLEKEFAVENALFWHDAEEFRTEFASCNYNLQKSVRIFNLYIEKDAPFAVNLDSNSFRHYRDIFSKISPPRQLLFQALRANSLGLLTRLLSSSLIQNVTVVPVIPEEHCGVLPSQQLAAFEYLTEDLFVRASNQLLQLMESDSLPRFLSDDANSRLWQDYVTGLKEQAVHDLVRDGSESNIHVLLESFTSSQR